MDGSFKMSIEMNIKPSLERRKINRRLCKIEKRQWLFAILSNTKAMLTHDSTLLSLLAFQ